MFTKITSLLAAIVLLTVAATAQVSVTTQHNDLLRSGWNNRETKLTPANVNVSQFGTLFRLAVDDQLYAQPLVIANVAIASGKHNVVYAATVNNTVYAADADNGTLYWSKNYTPATQRPPKNTDMTGACGGNYRDFTGNIGIVGTPVIDSSAQTIYFVARSIDNSTQFYQYLHAVDIRTGAEKTGSPMLITASVPGSGSGNINFIVPFEPQQNNQRQALTLANGVVYITFSSHCDWSPYHGWVLGYDKTSLQQKSVYNVTADGYGAGIWESGGGPSVDGNNMYLVTGNGSIGSGGNPSDFRQRSESALQLNIASPSAIVVNDFFTPKNYSDLEAADLDYGSMAAFLIPNTNLYLTGCKDGNLYLLDTANLGGFSTATNNVKQTVPLGSGVSLRCQPSYYRSATKEFIYVWSENSQLKAFPYSRSAGNLDVAHLVTGNVQGPSGQNGAVLSTSSNNSQDGTGIVWASYASNGDANSSTRPGILRAFDANDITKELWNSNQNATRDAAGNYAKFSAPSIANGKVYLPTFSNQLVVYGIIDTVVQSVCSTTNLALNQPAYASSVESNSTHYPSQAVDGNDTTRWASLLYSDTQWIYVDLGKRDSICNIQLHWETALAQNFLVQVSDDTSHWNTINSFTGNTAFDNNITVKTAGRYVRIYCTKRGSPYGYSMYEFQVFGSPAPGCGTPTGVTVNGIDTVSAIVRWNAVSGAANYRVQYKLSAVSTWKTVATTADTLKLTGLTCGNYYDYRVETICNSSDTSLYSATASFNTLACSNCGFLPTRTYTSDIGNVGIGGEACFTASPDTYRVNGSGKDVGGNDDAFRYVYKTFTGNGHIDALVQTQDAANPQNKAGVMFRQTLNTNSRNVFMCLTSGTGAVFQSRRISGSATTSTGLAGIKAPYYVRIAKSGTTYKGYVSANGINWKLVSSASVPMGANGASMYAGLAVCSHDNTKISNAVFRQFTIVFDSAAADSQAGGGQFYLQKDKEIATLNDAMKLKVYPNPAAGNFTVDFTVAQPQTVTVCVMGLSDGKMYYRENLNGFTGSYHKDNATFGLRNGSYIVFVKTAAGTLSRTLLIEK